ncbi:MAG: AAA family ATPase, partial [Thermoprotei archaeon]|nr:AAA family ATPase [Thermoprotei archaeon]
MPREGKERRREVRLRVAEAKQRDVGRGKVRIPPEIMSKLGITVGDVVEIVGKRRTAAIVWPAHAEDQGMDIIRMDGITRRNAGVSIGDRVIIRKANVRPASLIKLAPASITLSVDTNFVSYIKRRLLDYPLCEGDYVQIPVLGQPIPFVVVKTRPSGVVMVTDDTELVVFEKPVEVGRVPRVTYDDIGDLKEAKQRIREMVELPLKHPELFRRLGIEPPKGILLYGP